MKLSKVYNPKLYEADIYDLWEKTESFKPKNRGNDKTYSIVVPPPNANGDLHIGHALTLAIEDIATRYHRMKGEATLLLPGADHAGFETQVVYEKKLSKEGKSRFDFTREELYQQIWDFVAENKENYETQFRKLGASVDWSRYVFTLDEKIIQQAHKTFKKMWEEGLIYRGERLVNFCTYHGTGFADIEVEYKEEKGNLWHIKYPLTDDSGELIVATTRPETMLGDTAVAVNPKDKRYQKFIGKTIKLPLTNREIPIIADDFVSTEFGAGAVKITPAHDPNDHAIAERHDLPMITVINVDGTMTHEAGKSYQHLPVKDARDKVVSDLDKQELLVKTEDYSHSVGHCYKCGTVIEPLLREQWFVDMQPLAKQAISVLKNNQITFYPNSKKDQLIKYLEGLRDWNISRQIAWGIPIPAFQNIDNPEDWIFDKRVEEEFIEKNGKTYRRDPDVFDTWFSSSSWPYATLNYPDGQDFKDFYPLSLMETGGEILYQWVSRMIMLGLYTTGKIPFEAVYIHGYVMAEDGAKMSKSLGNVVHPMPVIDQYGSDALRMGIISSRAPAINRGYDSTKVEGARNFCNKLWNIARYIEGVVGDDPSQRHDAEPKTIADEWVLGKLQHNINKTSEYLDNYKFAEAYDNIYHLIWNDIADWYIEAGKSQPNKAMLAYVLEIILKLAHPFAPFTTETIWQTLAWEEDDILMTSTWPKPPKYNKNKAAEFNEIIQIVSEIRYITSVIDSKKPNLYYKNEPFITQHSSLIKQLTNINSINEVVDGKGLRLIQTKLNCWLDVDRQSIKEFTKALKDKIVQQEKLIVNLEKRLNNKSYVKNAPKNIVSESKQQLKDAQSKLSAMQEELERFEK